MGRFERCRNIQMTRQPYVDIVRYYSMGYILVDVTMGHERCAKIAPVVHMFGS